MYDRAKKILTGSPAADRVWAVGFHWYSGDHFEGLRLVHEKLNKLLLNTEFCCSFTMDIKKAAENYAKEICEDLNNYTAAICDWNILLNQYGGPYHNRTNTENSDFSKEDKSAGCYAPVLYDEGKKQLIYTPIYYYIAHFAKFIRPGAVRIATTKYTDKLYTCAFKNEDGGIVLIVLNVTDDRLPVNIRYNDSVTKVFAEPHSIQTVLL